MINRREPTQIGFNRRLLYKEEITMAPNPEGPVLPWTDLLALETVEGRRIAGLFTHAAHPVIVHAASDRIRADYPGGAVKTARESINDSPMVLFAGERVAKVERLNESERTAYEDSKRDRTG